jgi:hypothetical protein
MWIHLHMQVVVCVVYVIIRAQQHVYSTLPWAESMLKRTE